MLTPLSCLLIEILRKPSQIDKLTLSDWDLIIRQARRADVLAILAFRLQEVGLLGRVPEKPLLHLKTQQIVAQRHMDAIQWEVSCIEEALNSVNIPVVLLKGAAYSIAKLPSSKGRLYSDVDILVAKVDIERAEAALINFGWEMEKQDPYDQKYYRKWMHEIPPMTHKMRGTSIDVHHNILPETVKYPVDASKLLQTIQMLGKRSNVYILSSIDMVLHSMAHLFHEGELDHGLRDLLDLDALLKYFGDNDKQFWNDLVSRARELNLLLPLYYGLRYTTKLLHTPVPKNVMCDVIAGRPKFPQFIDFLFVRALMPDHVSCDDLFTGIARWLLYVRSHYLRMPIYLLIPHLIRKAYMSHNQETLERTI